MIGCGKILIIKPSSLGDIVHTLPAVEALHRSAPDAEICWIVNTEWAPLLEGIPHISSLIEFPRKNLRGPLKFKRARTWMNRHIKNLRPDLTLDFQGLLRSALMAKKANGQRTIGFRNAREGAHLFYDEKVEIPNWNQLHAIDRNLALARFCGASVAASQVTVTLPQGDYLPINGLAKQEKFILLHPFSRGDGKSLSKTEVAEFCHHFDPLPVVIVGSGVDWIEGSDPDLPERAYTLLGQTSLPQLIDLIRRAAFTVSTDSGPMHLAAAITDSLLSIHTWSDPMMVGPWRKQAFIWRDSEIWRVDEIEAAQFPERRNDRKDFANRDRLMSESDLIVLCSFVKQLV